MVGELPVQSGEAVHYAIYHMSNVRLCKECLVESWLKDKHGEMTKFMLQYELA